MNKVVGYTTGVYDMFHVGHLNLLRNASQHCDRLIVGISTDELVVNYKGKQPVIPFSDREAIIRAIRFVDEVRPQVSRDKYQQFLDIRYDILFVGDDWKDSEIFSSLEKDLEKHGAKIVYLPYTKAVSSTKLGRVLQTIYDEERLQQ